MRELGLGAYRLSTSWPRILPEGRGAANEKGLEFYDRLIDGIMEAGVEPWVCLYHWDLPQALEDRGGWQNRDTAHWFADYAHLAVRRLGDRVKHWATFNEPNCACYQGLWRWRARPRHPRPRERARGDPCDEPGARPRHRGDALGPRRSARSATSIISIPTSRRASARRTRSPPRCSTRCGTAPSPTRRCSGHYPEPFAAEMIEPLVQQGDLEIIKQKLDYFAFNHYTRSRVRRDPDHPFAAATLPPPPGAPVTEMGWEIAPDAFRAVLIEAKERYSGDLPVYILENGAAFPDRVDADGHIRDERRIAYLRGYLGAVQDAIAAGVPVKGYFVWSLLDNFEWTLGYSKRFGLVHVDYETQERRPKDSFDFYTALAHGTALDRE